MNATARRMWADTVSRPVRLRYFGFRGGRECHQCAGCQMALRCARDQRGLRALSGWGLRPGGRFRRPNARHRGQLEAVNEKMTW